MLPLTPFQEVIAGHVRASRAGATAFLLNAPREPADVVRKQDVTTALLCGLLDTPWTNVVVICHTHTPCATDVQRRVHSDPRCAWHTFNEYDCRSVSAFCVASHRGGLYPGRGRMLLHGQCALRLSKGTAGVAKEFVATRST
jgi:hypothetical protein